MESPLSVLIPEPVSPSLKNHQYISHRYGTKMDSDAAVAGAEDAKLSKNALKRKLKAEKLALVKGEKRAAEKQRKKQRKLESKKTNASSQQPERPKLTSEEFKEIKAQEIRHFIDYAKNNFSIIIDCAFKLHNERTLKSLCQQIMLCYGINRRSACPVTIHITGMDETQLQNLQKKGCSNWSNFFCHQEEYTELTDLFSTNGIKDTKEIVYLTAEAEETLENLSPGCAYVIGGIVDRNSFKGICYDKAKAQGLRMAKLPIKENYSMTGSHVLTVNHVFDVLLAWQSNGNSWKEAFNKVIPVRKVGGKVNQGTIIHDDIVE